MKSGIIKRKWKPKWFKAHKISIVGNAKYNTSKTNGYESRNK